MAEINLQEIAQIGLTVRDVARSKAFYQDVLGMRFLFDAGSMAFFQCGSVRLMLGASEADPAPPVGGTILYYKVDKLEGVCAALKTRGVEFVQDAHLVAKMPDHELWMAFFKDPDGNPIGVMSEVRG